MASVTLTRLASPVVFRVDKKAWLLTAAWMLDFKVLNACIPSVKPKLSAITFTVYDTLTPVADKRKKALLVETTLVILIAEDGTCGAPGVESDMATALVKADLVEGCSSWALVIPDKVYKDI